MTSMFDQFNNTLNREEQPGGSSSASATEPKTSGYVSVRIKEEPPIFSRIKMNLTFPNNITLATISNNWLCLLMSNNVLVRLNLMNTSHQNEVYLQNEMVGLRVSNLFLDPLANHLLISLQTQSSSSPPELLYLHASSKKARKIEKFRDHEVTAVAFNYNNKSDITTGSILIGTGKGLLFETEYNKDTDKRSLYNWKQVFDIGKGENCPITGIEFHKVPNTMKYFIIVTTLNRLYKFQKNLKVEEKPLYLYNIFNLNLTEPEPLLKVENKLKYSKLRFTYDVDAKYPKIFGWLTQQGIHSGEIDPSAETFLTNELIPFPAAGKEAPPKPPTYPISCVLTDFHALLLYQDHVKAVSLLNYQTVYEQYLNFTEQCGFFLDIVKDPMTGTIYAYNNNILFRYKITNEQRNVWRMYLDNNEFDLARKYSRDNAAHYDIVLVKQAELFFQQKDYWKSAVIYSETQSSFEAVCLKFLSVDNTEALMVYVRNRLDTLGEKDKTQITMLVVWTIELYLTEISRCADNKDRLLALQTEFDSFLQLPRVVDCTRTNRSVIYDLMASHGDSFNLTTLTTVNKDYESVINQYINQNNYLDALGILRSQNKPDLFYKYCPILMENIPSETVAVMKAQGKRLDAVKLLPTLISLDDEENPQYIEEVIKYLEFCILSVGNKDESIHNFLIKLYAQHKGSKLMTYLETEGKDVTGVHYDVYYALRVCREHDAKEACVFLQCLLELWQPAVELALQFDTKLAQQTANQPTDAQLRRKLWLTIAKHEITGKDDVKQALNILNECDLLRIEDLLPFFSDFEKIDHFKEAICNALKEYNQKIQEQRKDMDDSAKSAEKVRADLQSLRNRSAIISAQEQCSICGVCLLLKPFFLFPCGHKFHGDCLEVQIQEYLSPEDNRKLLLLKSQLLTTASTTTATTSNVPDDTTVTMSKRDKLRSEIENMLAADCLYCGEYMINSIDKPFIVDWEKVNNDWL